MEFRFFGIGGENYYAFGQIVWDISFDMAWVVGVIVEVAVRISFLLKSLCFDFSIRM